MSQSPHITIDDAKSHGSFARRGDGLGALVFTVMFKHFYRSF